MALHNGGFGRADVGLSLLIQQGSADVGDRPTLSFTSSIAGVVTDDPSNNRVIVNLDLANQNYAEVAIPNASPVSWNVSTAPEAVLTLTANVTMGPPAGSLIPGKWYTLRVVQGGAGGFQITNWNAAFSFGNNSMPDQSRSAGQSDIYWFYCASGTSLRCVAWHREGQGIVQGSTMGGVSGNQRGSDATDHQTNRTLAAQVASGLGATILGGSGCQASGSYAIAVGDRCGSTASYAFASGRQAVASNVGEFVRACGVFSSQGDAQGSIVTWFRQTTDATANVELFLDGSSGRFALTDDSTYAFSILLVARRADANDESAGYLFQGVIDRNAGAGTTALVGTVSKTIIAEDTAAWDADVVANAANGTLKIQVTGEAGKTIRWVAFGRIAKVQG